MHCAYDTAQRLSRITASGKLNERNCAAAHCGLRPDGVLSKEFPPAGVIPDWRTWLREAEDDDSVQRIRRYTKTGRPCGSTSFLDQLEHLLGRTLRPRKRGRKPKSATRTQQAPKDAPNSCPGAT